MIAAVLLTTQIRCLAIDGLHVAREAVTGALDRLGFSLEEPITISTQSESAAADISALANSCIIGHSHAVGMQMSLDVDGLDYIAEVGMLTEVMLYHHEFNLPGGSIGSLRYGLGLKDYERIFVLLGTNDMIGGASYLPEFKTSMEALLDTVEELQPDAEVCLLSIAPLSKGFQEFCYYNYGLTQELIDDYNYTIRAIAVSRGMDYLDITTPLSDKNGYLAAEYDRNDGLHFNADGNQVILDTILTHMGT